IAGVNAGRVRAHATRIARWRHAHAAEEGMQRDHDARGELCDHAPTIEWDDPRALRAVAIGRKKSAAAVVAVGQGEIDAENPHLEHVARIGPLHVDGPGENVSARALIGHLGDDVAQRLLHVGRRDACHFQAVGAVRDERFDLDGVARGDAQHGRRRGAVVAVGDGARRGGEPMEVLGGGERLATYGYFVLLPDLFYRSGPYAPMNAKTVFADPAQRKILMERFMSKATLPALMSDTEAFLEFLASERAVRPGGVATTGYCLGGAASLSAAGTYPDRIVAAASYHGGRLASDAPESPHGLAPKIKARVYVAGAID